ncbi:MAG: F0F1 ATP synthase subunit epsilon [Anaerolineae bacterium]
MPIRVDIVTQEGPLFSEAEADMVILPGTEGEMGVLPGHAALLTTLSFGELRVRKGNAEESFAVYGGVVEVRPERVIVLADTAESTFELDAQRAAEARSKAEETMKTGIPRDKMADVLQELRRANLQENILRRVKNRPATVRIREPKNGE